MSNPTAITTSSSPTTSSAVPVALLQPHDLEMTHKAKERVMVNTQLTNNVNINLSSI